MNIIFRTISYVFFQKRAETFWLGRAGPEFKRAGPGLKTDGGQKPRPVPALVHAERTSQWHFFRKRLRRREGPLCAAQNTRAYTAIRKRQFYLVLQKNVIFARPCNFLSRGILIPHFLLSKHAHILIFAIFIRLFRVFWLVSLFFST